MKKNLVSLSALFTAIIATTNAHAIIYEDECAAALALYIRAGTACDGGIETQECYNTMNDWAIENGEDYYELWETKRSTILNCLATMEGDATEPAFNTCARNYGWECEVSTCGRGTYFSNNTCVSCPANTYMDQTNHLLNSCFECPDYKASDGSTHNGETSSTGGKTSIEDCFIDTANEWEISNGFQRFDGDCRYSGS